MYSIPIAPARQGRLTSVILLLSGAIALITTYVVGIADNIPGILLLLLGSCAVLLGLLIKAGAANGLGPWRRILYWSPRVLCIVFAAFVSLFALDVFSEGAGFWGTAGSLFMHLLPTFFIVGVLVLSWRREGVGGIVFIALGVAYVILAWGRFTIGTYAIMSGPLVLAGALFLFNWYQKAKSRSASHA